DPSVERADLAGSMKIWAAILRGKPHALSAGPRQTFEIDGTPIEANRTAGAGRAARARRPHSHKSPGGLGHSTGAGHREIVVGLQVEIGGNLIGQPVAQEAAAHIEARDILSGLVVKI